MAGRNKRREPVAWGALCWALPIAYVFVDPYSRGAGWVEWTLTGLAFATFIGLYVIGLMHWTDRRVLGNVCLGVLALGIAFMAYRPSGAVFFPLVAAFAPFVLGGNLPRSVAAIAGVVAILLFEWWLLMLIGSRSSFRFAISLAVQTVVVSAGTAFMARQTPEIERHHRVVERERIARDLHDVLGHTLSSIALKSELAGRLLKDQPERALTEINDVERISRQALADVRAAIHGYHAGDIRAEFERAESILRAAGIAVEQRRDDIDIDPTHERVLALVVREAVTNVVRHAQAQTCRLALYRNQDEYRLEISDDGRGGEHPEGIGMSSIRSRVEAIGGNASWHGARGTQLAVTVPIAALASHS